MLVSNKIKKAAQAEIKTLEALKKSLQKQTEDYDVNNDASINQIEESIKYYNNNIINENYK